MKQTQTSEQKKKSQERIRQLIAEYANGSQQEFADACAVAKASISQYVNGTNAPGNITSAKIASRYGLNPLWVMGFDCPKQIKSDTKQPDVLKNVSMDLNDTELEIIKKYRFLDDHGVEIVNAVLQIEYDRCKGDGDTTVHITREFLEKLPMEQRIPLLKYEENDEFELKIARKNRRESK